MRPQLVNGNGGCDAMRGLCGSGRGACWWAGAAVSAAILWAAAAAAAATVQEQQPRDRGQAIAETEIDAALVGRYRLSPTDVLEISFPYVPEFDQTVTVQPDGYITLKGAGELRAQGRTLPELQTMLYEAYDRILREPVVTIVLKDFEKPYFVAAGALNKPGKFELRGATTVTQALAIAGGVTPAGKTSQVVVFRRYSGELLEVKQLNVSRMLDRKDLSEDLLLRPGDTLFVPTSVLAQIGRFIAKPQLALYLNPFHPY
jgi:polysaccharide biosynthesis/export protein